MQPKEQHPRVGIFTKSTDLAGQLRDAIPSALARTENLENSDGALCDGIVLALVDYVSHDANTVLRRLSESAVHTVLVLRESDANSSLSQLIESGVVDDVLLLPLRPIEVVSKVRHALHLSQLSQIVTANSDLKSLIDKFEEDLRTARAIQRSLIPEKFPEVNGMKVMHKYLSGLKSGGDYIDFFEFEDKGHVGVLLSDSTGYGVSSAFMSVMLKLAIRLSRDEARSPSATVSKIFEELQVTMKPREDLSLFYGIINRKTFEMKYTSCGSVRFVHQVFGENKVAGSESSEGGAAIELHDRSLVAVPPFRKDNPVVLKDHSVDLNPKDRLTFFTDGFGENFQGGHDLETVFKKTYGDDPIELINELTFRVKKKLESGDDMPAQDCSVLILDVEKRLMRLAK